MASPPAVYVEKTTRVLDKAVTADRNFDRNCYDIVIAITIIYLFIEANSPVNLTLSPRGFLLVSLTQLT